MKAAKRPINLLRGWPNPSLLPTASIARAAQDALSNPSISTPGLLYGPDPGFQPLRQQISSWLSGFYGSSEFPHDADAERICISGGASQNLACILQVYTDPVKTTIFMVAPCYFLACRIFEDNGLRLRAVEEGSEGVDLVALEKALMKAEENDGNLKPSKRSTSYSKIYRHIIYCVPTFSNPSGKTMSLAARKSLVLLARKHDALIVTDDVYDFLQFPTSSSTSAASLTKALLPRLFDVDRTLEPVPSKDSFGNAVSNGSFSKIAGPGVRTGWAEASPRFAYGLSQCGSSRSGGAPSQLAATIMYELLQNGELQRHIENVLNPAYRRRYEAMMVAITSFLIPLGVTVGEVSFGDKSVFGGYFIWINLPRNATAKEVTERCKAEENLIVAPGDVFEVQGDESVKFENALRLCFSWEEEQDLGEGVRRLGKVIEDVTNEVKDSGEGGSRVSKVDLGEFQ